MGKITDETIKETTWTENIGRSFASRGDWAYPRAPTHDNTGTVTEEDHLGARIATGLVDFLMPRNDTTVVGGCGDCGEAGCSMDEINGPRCMCITLEGRLVLPQADEECPPPIIKDPINPDSKVQSQQSGNRVLGPSVNETSSQPLIQATPAHVITPESPTITIVLSVAGVLTLIFLCVGFALALVLRKRRNITSRTPTNESAISWLHRQDSALLLEHMSVLSKNPTYFTSEIDSDVLASIHAKLIPRESIRLCEEIGEGAFGKVFKGEIRTSGDRITKVAIKVLKEDVSREIREDFKHEVEIMSSFDHENILHLIGIVNTDQESPYMVFEYMEYGDLTELLRRNDPFLGFKTTVELKQTDLMDIAIQVANGMCYLASRHFVHRDLATRNCLVGLSLVVKIADFGMSRDIYTCDYYKIGGSRMLPVRWMSPESVKYGKYTTESDVWAYGVVLWEIFTYGKQPYYGHSNEEVIRFLEDGVILVKPEDCLDIIYQLMLGTWRVDPKQRFTFIKIYKYLVDYKERVARGSTDTLPATDNLQENGGRDYVLEMEAVV